MTKVNNFTAGSIIGDGNAVTLNNSDDSGEDIFTIVNKSTGATMVYKQDASFPGGWCAEVTNASGATNSPDVVQLTEASGSADMAVRCYVKLTGAPGADIGFPFQPRNTADAQQGGPVLKTTGIMSLKNAGGTVLATGTQAVPTDNSLQRMEFVGTAFGGSAGVWTMKFFPGQSTTATDTVTASSVVTTGSIDRVRAGRTSNGLLATFRIGGFVLAVGQNTFIGPADTNIAVSDSELLTEVSLLAGLIGVTDAETLADAAGAVASALSVSDPATVTDVSSGINQGIFASDSQTQSEVETDTSTDEGLDDSFLTDSADLSVGLTGSDSWVLTELAVLVKQAITSTLRTTRPGSYWVSPTPEDRYKEKLYYRIPVGGSLAKINGVWVMVNNPSEATVNSAEYFFGGGRIFTIPTSVALELIAAGYGDLVTEDL